MGRYIALLRGINVGGNNIISMAKLREAFEAHGFTDVKTYINSGNVIFSAPLTDEAALKLACEQIILAAFGLVIAVAIISAVDLQDALAHAPDWWGTGEDIKHNTIFVMRPANAEEIIAEVGPTAPEYERIAHHGQVIFWSAPIKTFSKVRWIRIVGTSAYQNVTIRNANTARKLLALSM